MSKKYKIHLNYVTSNGQVVKAGIYEEGTFDLAEARHRSVVTLTDIEPKTTVTDNIDDLPVTTFNNDSTEVKNIKVSSQVTTTKIDFLKINSAPLDTIAALKYVSKKNAEDVVRLRADKPFVSYSDLNKRVPLKFSRIWEDLTPIDFEESISHDSKNSLYFSEGLLPLE